MEIENLKCFVQEHLQDMITWPPPPINMIIPQPSPPTPPTPLTPTPPHPTPPPPHMHPNPHIRPLLPMPTI